MPKQIPSFEYLPDSIVGRRVAGAIKSGSGKVTFQALISNGKVMTLEIVGCQKIEMTRPQSVEDVIAFLMNQTPAPEGDV